jgi:chromosome segregation ATPase
MIEKLKEILGIISGYKAYKDKYEELQKEHEQAEAIVDEILFKLKDAYGTVSRLPS